MKEWYGVRVKFQANVDGIRPVMLENSIFLIQAESEEEAKIKGSVVGRNAQHSYTNENEERIDWVFQAVVEVQSLCVSELSDGIEVFSRLDWA